MICSLSTISLITMQTYHKTALYGLKSKVKKVARVVFPVSIPERWRDEVIASQGF